MRLVSYAPAKRLAGSVTNDGMALALDKSGWDFRSRIRITSRRDDFESGSFGQSVGSKPDAAAGGDAHAAA
jgi:hypothetical protein